MADYDSFYHRRRSIRLDGWDYRHPAAYFVTVCTHGRANLFDNPAFASIAADALERVPSQKHAAHVALDEWVVMPNHIHAIFIFTRSSDQPADSPPQPTGKLRNALAGSLGVVVGRYKTAVTTRINKVRVTPGTAVWQRGYYERIIRNEREFNATRQYIRDNPIRWAEDRENLDALIARMTCQP